MLKTLDAQAPVDPLVAFRDDVLGGLSAPVPAIPARWLYDRRGSELFDQITRLPSYYPTRTETAIFHEIMPEVAARVPGGAVVVEFGAGSATKTPILLEAISRKAFSGLREPDSHHLSEMLPGRTTPGREMPLAATPACGSES